MTEDLAAHYTLLDELDARQNDVLAQLDELNERIETLLNEFTKPTAVPAAVPLIEKAA